MRRNRVRDVNDDGEVVGGLRNVAIVATPVDPSASPSAPPATPPTAPPSGPILLTLLDKPLRLDADGFVIPELPIPSPLPISSLPGTPIDITGPPTPQCVEKAQDHQHSAIAEEVIESEIASLLDGSATSITEELRDADRQVREECPASTISDGLDNLGDVDDDPEVQNAMLTEEECEKIWVELNKDYLSEQECKILPFFPFSFNLSSPPNECHGVANMDIIMKRPKKETDLRNGITETAKKRKKDKSSDSNSKVMVATPAHSAKNVLMRRSYSKKINYKAIEGFSRMIK
ncbi:hypothetical protein HOY80DRAFT_1134288 [Tuber brumale]|nr:hypothetical protein HOY80DRAFT_1134288 [Tuber brumale]